MGVDHLITQKKRDSNNQQWYREIIDSHCVSPSSEWFAAETDDNSVINYNLYNNILDVNDMQKYTAVLGAGDMPENMSNKDIFSPKIKALEGLVGEKTFKWRLYPLNPDATTRQERERNDRYKRYVEAQVMQPIIKSILEEQAKNGNVDATQEQIQQELQKQIAENTPDEIEKYMSRKHQDPVEQLGNQIFEWIIRKDHLKSKFQLGWKHAALSAKEFYLITRTPGGVTVLPLDPTKVRYALSEDDELIQKGEWASYHFYMTPGKIIEMYGDVLSDKEKREVMDFARGNESDSRIDSIQYYSGGNTIRVEYVCFRSMKKVGFLTYEVDGELEGTIVNDTYKFDESTGDVDIEWEWIPQVHHGTRIHKDIYVNMEPVPFDTTIENDMYNVSLPICGGVYDSTNSEPTSIGDRLRVYQYLYNAVMWKMEKLMASDKGRKLLIDPTIFQGVEGMDIDKMFSYMNKLDMIPVNNASENRAQGNTLKGSVDQVDLSLASDIKKYIEIASYIESRASEAVGIPKEMQGNISPYMPNSSVNQSLSSASNILEPYFRMHNTIVQSVLELALNATISYYIDNPKDEALPYVLDDMSMGILELNSDYLHTASLGLYMANTGKADQIKQDIKQLSNFALQNQMLSVSGLVRVMEEENYASAREILEQSEREMHERQRELNEQNTKAQGENIRQQQAADMQRLQFERETDIMLQQMKGENEIRKASIVAIGFDQESTDRNGNNTHDAVDEAERILKERKLSLDERKESNKMEIEREKLKITKEKNDK